MEQIKAYTSLVHNQLEPVTVHPIHTEKSTAVYPRQLFVRCRFHNLFYFQYHLFVCIQIHRRGSTAWWGKQSKSVLPVPTLTDFAVLKQVLTSYYSHGPIGVFHFPFFKWHLIKFVLRSFSQLSTDSSTLCHLCHFHTKYVSNIIVKRSSMDFLIV